MKYLGRLHFENLNPLLKDAFELSKTLDSEGVYTWYTYAKNLSLDINIDLKNIESCKNIKSLNVLKKIIKNETDIYYKKILETKVENLQESNKLYLYKFLKIDHSKLEYYLNHPNFEIRKLLTKFRISDHPLLIETGRYRKLPREERTCIKCKNEIDDECHFFLHCNMNKNIREHLLNHFNTVETNFDNLKNVDKLKRILNPSTPYDIEAVTSFIKQSLELRREDIDIK